MDNTHDNNQAESLKPSYGFKGLITVWLASLFFLYQFIQMGLFNTIGPTLIEDDIISSEHLAYINSIFFIMVMIFALPAGLALDRYKTETIIITAMAASTVASILAGIYPITAELLWFVKILQGLAHSLCFISLIQLAYRYCDTHYLGIGIGGIITLGMMGGMISQYPYVTILQLYGINSLFIVNAILGVLILFIIIARFYYLNYKKLNINNISLNSSKIHFWSAIKNVTFNRNNWQLSLYTAWLNLPFMLLGTIFGQWYLQESHLLSDGHAAVVTTTLFVGMLLGSPLIGAFAQNARYERVIMCIGSLLTLSLLILLELFSWSFISLIFIFFLIGLTASTQNIPYSIISARNAPLYSATAIGLSSLIIMAFIGFSQPIFNLFIIQDEINDTVDFSMGLYLLMFLTVCTFFLAFNHKPKIIDNDSNI